MLNFYWKIAWMRVAIFRAQFVCIVSAFFGVHRVSACRGQLPTNHRSYRIGVESYGQNDPLDQHENPIQMAWQHKVRVHGNRSTELAANSIVCRYAAGVLVCMCACWLFPSRATTLFEMPMTNSSNDFCVGLLWVEILFQRKCVYVCVCEFSTN